MSNRVTRLLPLRWRRETWAVVSVLLVILVAVSARTGWLPAPKGGDYERYDGCTATVVRVIDGDTLDIDLPDRGQSTTRIRLWGVDAPEISRAGDTGAYFGEESRAFARDMMEDQSARIELSPLRTRDKYGRLLAYVYQERSGQMLNQALLESGLAYADPRFEHARLSDFKRVERLARQDGVGLWRGVKPEFHPEWKKRRPLSPD